jgi:hypothetical protein
MSRIRGHFDGLAEFKQELRNLPEHLKEEAETIVRGRARLAATLIVRKYPERDYGQLRGRGNLRKGVALEEDHSRFGLTMVVRQTAKHGWIYENGTEARHTRLNGDRGRMPPGHVFIPIIIDQRRKMYEDLAAMMKRNGLEVELAA